jgi:hypothetical protein
MTQRPKLNVEKPVLMLASFERRIVMLARVWQKTLVASVRRSSVTVTTPR